MMIAFKNQESFNKNMKNEIRQKVGEIKGKVEKIEEKIINVPNAVSLLRILGTPFLVYIIFSDFSDWFKASAFLVFALSDMVDGYIARHLNQKTNFGAKFDIFADRIFFTAVILTIFIRLFIFSEDIIVNRFLFLFILSREIIALPIAGYMFFTKTPFLKTKWTGKLTTFMQGAAVASLLFGFNFTIYLVILAGFFGIMAGINYWKDSLEILTKK